MRIDHGHSRQPLGKWYGPVGYRIYGEAVAHGGGGTRTLPVKGKVNRGEASSQGPRGVVCPAHRERGEGGVKARRCRVYLRQGADDSKSRQPLPLGDQKGVRGKAGFHRKDSGGGGCEVIRRPSPDSVPEGVES